MLLWQLMRLPNLILSANYAYIMQSLFLVEQDASTIFHAQSACYLLTFGCFTSSRIAMLSFLQVLPALRQVLYLEGDEDQFSWLH